MSTIYTELNQYHVVMEVAPEFWQGPDALRDIYVRSGRGAQVPLTAFARFEPSAAPLAVNHQGQFPAVTLSFNLMPGVSLGEAVDAIEARVARHRAAGQRCAAASRARRKRSRPRSSNQPLLILAALVTVYIVLGMLYESYIHPITILSTLPSAGVGALLALLLCNIELTSSRSSASSC